MATPDLIWSEIFANHYAVSPNITYDVENGTELHLDVWKNTAARTAAPTLVYFHGGGWIFGDKLGAAPVFMPYLLLGWNIVNVEYRFKNISLAPAAVQDARCALRWAFQNAKAYNIDTARIVTSGHSAGGHLALMAAMLPQGNLLDSNCPGDESLRVAAVVDWYGITDVSEILSGPDRQTYAEAWVGAQPERETIAKLVSPLTYARSGLPPVFMVHGDRDPTVPYSQSVRLHNALTGLGVSNELFTVAGGVHGTFDDASVMEAYVHLWLFLRKAAPSLAPALPPE